MRATSASFGATASRTWSAAGLAFQRSQIGAKASPPGASPSPRPASRKSWKISAPLPRCEATCPIDHSESYDGSSARA